MENPGKDPVAAWDNRWRGSEEHERISLLGRRMFAAKKKVLRKVLSTVQAKNAIEVGCGLGHTLETLVEAGFDAEGIDISTHAVTVCKNKGLKAGLLDVKNAVGPWDLVSSDGLLEHFADFKPVAGEFMRISRRYILLIQPDHGSILGRGLWLLSDLLKKRKNVYEYDYRIEEFIGVFENGGFACKVNRPMFGRVFRVLLFEKTAAVNPARGP